MERVEKPVDNMGARCVNLTFCTIFLINLSFKLSQIQKPAPESQPESQREQVDGDSESNH